MNVHQLELVAMHGSALIYLLRDPTDLQIDEFGLRGIDCVSGRLHSGLFA